MPASSAPQRTTATAAAAASTAGGATGSSNASNAATTTPGVTTRRTAANAGTPSNSQWTLPSETSSQPTEFQTPSNRPPRSGGSSTSRSNSSSNVNNNASLPPSMPTTPATTRSSRSNNNNGGATTNPGTTPRSRSTRSAAAVNLNRATTTPTTNNNNNNTNSNQGSTPSLIANNPSWNTTGAISPITSGFSTPTRHHSRQSSSSQLPLIMPAALSSFSSSTAATTSVSPGLQQSSPVSSTTTITTTTTSSRQLRNTSMSQPTLKRTGTSGSGSMSNISLGSLHDLSPGGSGGGGGGSGSSGTNNSNRLSLTNSNNNNNNNGSSNSGGGGPQIMRAIPSPLAKSPATWHQQQSPQKMTPPSKLNFNSHHHHESATLPSTPANGNNNPFDRQQNHHHHPHSHQPPSKYRPRSSFGIPPGGSLLNNTNNNIINSSGGGHGGSDTGTMDDLGPLFLEDHDPFMMQYQERSIADHLRAWRTDATNQQFYNTAVYWGDKLLSLTDNDPNDLYWLSHVYFLQGEYARAFQLLQKKRLVETSVACRYLAIQCLIKSGKWMEALEYLGEENLMSSSRNGGNKSTGKEDETNNHDQQQPPPRQEQQQPRQEDEEEEDSENGIKLEASMCHLRGLVFKHFNNLERAKECFREALQIDVKCYEAFDALIINSMLTVKQEQELLSELKFEQQLGSKKEAELLEMLYRSKLKKYDEIEQQEKNLDELSILFKTENADLILAKAEIFFAQYRFDKCLECTKKILKSDKYNLTCLPMHLVCLYELDLKNDLFYLAHELVDQFPTHAVTWFGVGVYYYLIGKHDDARRYFGKSSTMDKHYGPAWIGFGHSFAADGDHEKAIAAYATSTKLFQGSHLGSLFIGMQHLQQNNIDLAEKYLWASFSICESDPLLLNELGVLYYNKQQYQESIDYFDKVVLQLKSLGSKHRTVLWETVWMNLGHAHRRLLQYDQAQDYFEKVDAVTIIGPTKASALMALGFVYQIRNWYEQAIDCYHKVLAIRPGDQGAGGMLQKVLDDKVRLLELSWMDNAVKDDEMIPTGLRPEDNVTRLARLKESLKHHKAERMKMSRVMPRVLEVEDIGSVDQGLIEEEEDQAKVDLDGDLDEHTMDLEEGDPTDLDMMSP